MLSQGKDDATKEVETKQDMTPPWLPANRLAQSFLSHRANACLLHLLDHCSNLQTGRAPVTKAIHSL
jgi:hypothetical protein